MSRPWAVLAAFVIGVNRYLLPLWRWNRPADWPPLILAAVFVVWLMREPAA